jgi:hypothetical protein
VFLVELFTEDNGGVSEGFDGAFDLLITEA